jgi:hypothetical protein
MTVPRVIGLFPTLVTSIPQGITHQTSNRTLVHSTYHGRLLRSVQLGTARHKIPAPWYSSRYWVREPNRTVDGDADFQTMPTRLAITLPRTSISFYTDYELLSASTLRLTIRRLYSGIV